jgi:hypothetical protein
LPKTIKHCRIKFCCVDAGRKSSWGLFYRLSKKARYPVFASEELEPVVETQIAFRDNAFEDDVAKSSLAPILGQDGLINERSL